MNLWVKSLGRLAFLAVALFFSSCEDEASYLGFRKSPKFNVTAVDLALSANSVFSIDSIITDNKSAIGNLLFGEYNDPKLGDIRAEGFVQVFPAGGMIPADALLDSMTVQFRLNFYAYGFSGVQTQVVGIHEITSDSLSISNPPGKRYWNSDEFGYDPTPLTEASLTVNYDTLKKLGAVAAERQDTLLVAARLPDAFTSRIFNHAKSHDYSKKEDRNDFLYAIKGLALIPKDMNGILGIGIQNSQSRITIYYRTLENGAVKDTLQRQFLFSSAAFTHMEADRGGTELSAITQHYQPIQPASNQGYVQSGTPIISEIDLSEFYAFADQDSNKNLIINSAELVIGGVEAPAGLPPHSSLVMKAMSNQSNDFANTNVSSDSIALAHYNLIPSNHYYVRSDEPSANPPYAQLRYDDETGTMRVFLTMFVQDLFINRVKGDNVINPDRLLRLALYPYSPAVFTAVNRTVFDGNNVTLSIRYTRPSESTP